MESNLFTKKGIFKTTCCCFGLVIFFMISLVFFPYELFFISSIIILYLLRYLEKDLIKESSTRSQLAIETKATMKRDMQDQSPATHQPLTAYYNKGTSLQSVSVIPGKRKRDYQHPSPQQITKELVEEM